jgi:putative acetyltransferase
MHLQTDVFPIHTDDFPRVVDVWEASVRATHHFVSEADIQLFRPLVRSELKNIPHLACVRDETGQLAGFVAVAQGKVEMLFLHPTVRGQGAGGCLLTYAIRSFGATTLDVNEQNEQAVGFYLRMGFAVVGRSELDGMGKPYPLLHLQLRGEVEAGTPNVS